MMRESLPPDFYGSAPETTGLPEANPSDVGTIEAIVQACYETISGPAGQPRDWNRMRTLFLPDSRSIRTGKLSDGTIGYHIMRSQDYIAQMNDWLVENGFFETEIHRVAERYGNIAHVFSTYESRRSAADPIPFMRGINSFQLFYDGRRWWIMNLMWRHESPELPIPEKYLPKKA